MTTPTSAPGRAAPIAILGQLWTAAANLRVLLGLIVLLIIGFGIAQPIFLTPGNLINAISAVAVLWFIAMGATLVLVSGGIDLSSGAVAAASGIMLAQTVMAGVPLVFAAIISVVFGAVLGGVVNGVLVGYVKLNVFVVTLASMTAITGAVSLWTGTQSFYVSDPALAWIATGTVGSVPVVIIGMVLVFLILLFVQRRTHFGRSVYAVGGGILAARLSGIRTASVTAAVYAIAGATAAIGGVVAVGRIGAATPVVDNSLPLQAIAAILLGGTSLAGGMGGVGGTALGVLFLGLLQNGLSISGVPSFWQQVLTGVVLVVAVLGDRFKSRRAPAVRRPVTAAAAAPAPAPAPEAAPLVTAHKPGSVSGS